MIHNTRTPKTLQINFYIMGFMDPLILWFKWFLFASADIKAKDFIPNQRVECNQANSHDSSCLIHRVKVTRSHYKLPKNSSLKKRNWEKNKQKKTVHTFH